MITPRHWWNGPDLELWKLLVAAERCREPFHLWSTRRRYAWERPERLWDGYEGMGRRRPWEYGL